MILTWAEVESAVRSVGVTPNEAASFIDSCSLKAYTMPRRTICSAAPTKASRHVKTASGDDAVKPSAVMVPTPGMAAGS